MQRLLIVEHGPHAPAGLLAGWAAGQGMTSRTVALHAGERFPADVLRYDAAVVLGSEHAAYDDTVPWLAAELSVLERLVAEPVPVLGICFGAQALARVLGSRLYRLSEPEIGWARITSNAPALAEGPWLSWHYDAFDLPPGAAELASNEVSLQAFGFGPHAGVQFHPEATEPIAKSWAAIHQPPPGMTGSLFAGPDGAWERAAGLAPALFSAWLDGGLAGTGG